MCIRDSILADQKGYVYFPKYEEQMPYRRFFVKVEPPRGALKGDLPKAINQGEDLPVNLYHYRTCHIHAVIKSHIFWEDHLLFRNLLRQNPIVREQYGLLKQDLARIRWSKSDEYSSAKADFIRGCLNDMKRPA